MPDRGSAEREHAALHVIGDIAAVTEQGLQYFSIFGAEGQDLFPGSLIQDQLQGNDSGLAGVLRGTTTHGDTNDNTFDAGDPPGRPTATPSRVVSHLFHRGRDRQ